MAAGIRWEGIRICEVRDGNQMKTLSLIPLFISPKSKVTIKCVKVMKDEGARVKINIGTKAENLTIFLEFNELRLF